MKEILSDPRNNISFYISQLENVLHFKIKDSSNIKQAKFFEVQYQPV